MFEQQQLATHYRHLKRCVVVAVTLGWQDDRISGRRLIGWLACLLAGWVVGGRRPSVIQYSSLESQYLIIIDTIVYERE